MNSRCVCVCRKRLSANPSLFQLRTNGYSPTDLQQNGSGLVHGHDGSAPLSNLSRKKWQATLFGANGSFQSQHQDLSWIGWSPFLTTNANVILRLVSHSRDGQRSTLRPIVSQVSVMSRTFCILRQQHSIAQSIKTLHDGFFSIQGKPQFHSPLRLFTPISLAQTGGNQPQTKNQNKRLTPGGGGHNFSMRSKTDVDCASREQASQCQ